MKRDFLGLSNPSCLVEIRTITNTGIKLVSSKVEHVNLYNKVISQLCSSSRGNQIRFIIYIEKCTQNNNKRNTSYIKGYSCIRRRGFFSEGLDSGLDTK